MEMGWTLIKANTGLSCLYWSTMIFVKLWEKYMYEGLE